jgi:hypothetical protein
MISSSKKEIRADWTIPGMQGQSLANGWFSSGRELKLAFDTALGLRQLPSILMKQDCGAADGIARIINDAA